MYKAIIFDSYGTIISTGNGSIEPEVTYTQEDLNWKNKNSRSSVEMSDLKSRPMLADKEADLDNHNVIFIGLPI